MPKYVASNMLKEYEKLGGNRKELQEIKALKNI